MPPERYNEDNYYRLPTLLTPVTSQSLVGDAI
jgi:hypothetical protein